MYLLCNFLIVQLIYQKFTFKKINTDFRYDLSYQESNCKVQIRIKSNAVKYFISFQFISYNLIYFNLTH